MFEVLGFFRWGSGTAVVPPSPVGGGGTGPATRLRYVDPAPRWMEGETAAARRRELARLYGPRPKKPRKPRRPAVPLAAETPEAAPLGRLLGGVPVATLTVRAGAPLVFEGPSLMDLLALDAPDQELVAMLLAITLTED